jgi:RNA polymerase sigma factor (sigma-70 family)
VTVDDDDLMAARFEAQRTRLRAVAYRMLGSASEADDAVQEAWLRLHRSDGNAIDNLSGWLTTVVARVALDMLKARDRRREDYVGSWLPEPLVTTEAGAADPEHEALIADSVGLALLVVLETLAPKERLAFVLHDTFGVPFTEIAAIIDSSPDAARQMASRARRRVRGAPAVDADLARQRELVDAFLAAAREGDFDALVEVLHPEVVLRSDGGAARPLANHVIRGAAAVAGRALTYARLSPFVQPVLVNGVAGVLVAPRGRPFSVMAFTVAGGRVVAIDALADPARLERLDQLNA